VLIIDDEGPYNKVIGELLTSLGLRVRSALHGLGGLFSAKRDRPDLILLDLMMPELDGLGTVRRIRSDPALASTPVVVVSALVGEADRQAALAAGADAFLGKPFTFEELKAAISPFLEIEAPESIETAETSPAA
jgi:CheY-like chemotaxis protein